MTCHGPLALILISLLGFPQSGSNRPSPPALPEYASPQAIQPDRIALVDVETVLEKCAELKVRAEHGELITEIEEARQARNKLAEEGMLLTKLLRELPAGTPEHQATVKEIQAVRETIQGLQVGEKQRILQQELEAACPSAAEVAAALNEYARKHNLALISPFNPTPLTETTSPKKVVEQISSRRFLYHQESLDITNQLIQLIDRKRQQVVPSSPEVTVATTSQPERIALMDFGAVFKQSEDLHESMNQLKAEVRVADKQAQQMAAEIEKHQADLKGLQKGTPEYQALEQTLLEAKNKFEVFLKVARYEFAKKEVEIYRVYFLRYLSLVEHYAPEHGYTLILRHTSAWIGEVKSAEEIVNTTSSNAILYHASHDITEDILKLVNGPDQPTAQPVSSATQQGKGQHAQPDRIAMLDLREVFKQSTEFQATLEQLKQEKQEAEKNARQNLRQDSEQAFQQKELRAHRHYYQQVMRAIQEYAQEHGYTLVLRYDPKPVPENQTPAELIQELSGLDYLHYGDSQVITDAIIQRLNEKSKSKP